MSGRLTDIRALAGASVMMLVALAIVLVVVLTSGSSKASVPQQHRVITFGALFSLTGAGDVYGPQQQRGAQLAVDEINAEGGVDGIRLGLIVHDDKSSPTLGKQLMTAMVAGHQVAAVLGPSLSLVATAADATASEHRTPVMAVSNTANGIVGRCAYNCSWVWRDSLGEATAVPAAIRWLTEDSHVSSAAIVNVSADVLGETDAQVADAAFKRAGVPVISRVQVPASGSLAEQISRVVAAQPDVLVIGATSGIRATEILQAARAQGFSGPIIGGNVFNSAATAGLVGKAGIGTISGAAWYAGNDFPANSQFVADYVDRYGMKPDQFAAQAYTGVELLAEAIRVSKLGSQSMSVPAEREAIQASLPKVALLTPLGQLRFTRDHDVSQTVWILRKAAGSTHRLAGFCDPGC